MKTSDLFIKELGFINNPIIKKITIETLNTAPECIQIIPASSSGRYHPEADRIVGSVDENGNVIPGGLVNHVKTVTAYAKTLTDTEIFKTFFLMNEDMNMLKVSDYKDCVIAACILHDCMKPDDTDKHKTVFDHPTLAANLFKKIVKKNINDANAEYLKKVVPIIYGCIASHMGEWNTAVYAKGITLPKPSTSLEYFVHMCDYLASRKLFDFNFDAYKEFK